MNRLSSPEFPTSDPASPPAAQRFQGPEDSIIRCGIRSACSAVAVMIACAGLAFVPQAAMAATSVGITKTTNASSPQPSGQTFKYDLSYSCSSTTGSAHNVVITDVLPPDIEFVSLTPTTHVATYTTPSVGSTGTVTLNLINPLPSGSAGIVPVFVRYKAGVTANGTVSSNTASIVGSDAPLATSSVSTTSSAASTWAVSKTGATTATLGPTGVTYTVALASSGTTIGQLDLQNATMVDTLPVGVLPADVLDAAGATVTGTGVSGNPVTLTWSLGTLSSVGTQPAASKTVTIRYPASQFTNGQVVQNAATASGTPVGGSLTNLGPANVNTTLSLPVVTRSLSKVASPTSQKIGETFDWQLNPVSTAAVALDNFTVTDTLPGNFTLQSVFTGTGYTGQPTGNFVNLRYKTTANSSWTPWPLSPFGANTTQNVSDLGLTAGVYVTDVEINYGTVRSGFAASGTAANQPRVTGFVNNPTPNGSTVVDGSLSVNNATLTSTYDGVAVTQKTATNTVTIPTTTKAATFTKAASNTGPLVGQSFGWQLNPANTGTSPFDNFTVTDTLPGNFTLQSVFTGTGYTSQPGGNFVNLRYKTTTNSSWTTWTGSPFAANTTQLVSALGLAGGVYVTDIEINYGTVQVSFAASATPASRPTLTGVVSNPMRNGQPPVGGTAINNTNAALTASYGNTAITPVLASATANLPADAGSMTLTKTASNATPPIGQAFSYYLRPVNTGNSVLDSVTMVDTLPNKFTLQSVYTGNNYVNPPSGSFVNLRYKTTTNSSWTTWTGSPFAVNTTQNVSTLGLTGGVYVTAVEMSFGTVPVGFAASVTPTDQPRLTGVVSIPARDGTTVNTNDVISNPATMDASVNSIPLTQVNASADVTMSTAGTSSLTKAPSNATPAIGQAFDWQLSPANTGVVALNNFILTDTLPSQFELKSVFTGTGYSPSNPTTVTLRYKTTNKLTYQTWGSFAANTTQNVSALSLAVGEYVTVVELNFGTVAVGFATSGTAGNKPKLTGVVNNPARDTSAVVSGTIVNNTNTTLTADYNSSAIAPATASALVTMANGTTLTKNSGLNGSGTSVTQFDFGQPFEWRLRPVNATGAGLTSFIVTDTLPSQFELTSVYTGTSWTTFPATGVFIRYTTTTNPSYTLWPGGGLSGGAYAQTTTANVSALNLAAGVYVTAVQFDFGTVVSGCAASSTVTSQPRLTGVVQKVARDNSIVSTVTPITSIINNAQVTATLSGTPLQATSASATVTMKTPTVLTATFSKAASLTTQQLGQPFDWQLTPAATTTPTTLALNNFTVTDTLPGAFELQSVYTGTSYANSPTGNFIGIRYKTTTNSNWTTWTGSPFAANATVNVSSLGLTAGAYVTDVEINYGTVAGNFAASATAANKPRLTGVVNSPARNGATIPDNGTVTNSNASLSATFGGVAITPQTASASVTLNTLKIKPYSVKTVPSLSYIPGGTIPFQVETWNDSTSQGSMVNPVGTDLLPDQVDYLPGTFAAVTSGTYNSAGVAAPVLTIIPNFSGTRTLLRWQYSGSFAPNTRATVTFNVKVRSGTSSSDYTNLSGASATAATNQQISYPSGVLDTLDLNGNGSTTDYISQSTAASFNVGTSAAVDATKWVKGVLDKVYTKYPDYGVTVAGGSISYNINITNVGSVNLNNLILVDLLPSVGDVGVVDTSPRLSAWTPELTRPILVDNATVLYSTQANPDRTEVGGPTTGNAPSWSATLPADPTTVRSFKIIWNTSVVLTPGQALNFYIPMRAPLDAADGTIAWNSFAWAADPTGFPHLSAEPNKVGVGVLNTGKAIGNFVWLDENSDGYQDPGEPGIPNVKVNLYDSTGALVASTWTDSSGHYLFKHLDANNKRLQAADYYVRVDASTLPPGVSQTPPSTLPNADFGNQDQSAGYGYLVPATNSGADMTADFGYNYNPASDVKGNTGTGMIGDRVWLDLNGDGKQTPDEIGISGVQLQLITAGPDGLFGTADDMIVATTTTDATGYYRFDGLATGAYQVKVSGSGSASHNILGGGHSQTGDPDHFGATSALSNDNLSTMPIVLGPGDVFLDADFGYQPTSAALGSIGDFVWLDADASGTSAIQAGEYGLPNVTLALIKDTNGNGTWDAGEPIIATTTTAADGAYLFTGLPLTDAADGSPTSAKYLVWVNDTNNALAQLRQTYDSNGLASPNLSAATLSPGTPSVSDQDFTYAPASQPDNTTAVIGDKVWFDANRNGILDGTELGVPGVLMELVDSYGRVLALTLTDTDGLYFFGGLSPGGTYSVRVAARNFLAGKPLAGLVNTYDADGGLDGVSLVHLGATGNEGTADPDGIKNGLNLGQDFGYGPPSGSSNQGTIGNLIWLDDNANGVRDGVNGPDGQANTDDDEPGIQGVTVDLFRDLNNNGKLDPGEPLIATTTTDANGAYLFSGLPLTDGIFDPLIYATDPDASYVVRVSDRNGVLRGYWHSLGTAGTDNQSQINPTAVTLTNTNPNVLSADYGFYVEPAAIGDYVWVDTNGNGLQDEPGTGLANVEVILTITYPDSTVTTLKTLTDASGHYIFGNLLQDENYTQGGGGSMPSFVVSIAPSQPALAIYSQTHIGVGSNSRLDSNNPVGTIADPVKGLVSVTGQSSPSTMPTYDFGYFPTSELLSLGNRLWVDSNNNGIMDAGEPGLANVQVDLIDSTGVAVQATTYTDSNGFYRFDGLLPGNYSIHIPATNWTGISGSPGGVLDGSTPLAGYRSSFGCASAAQTSGTLAVNGIDHGVDDAYPETNGIGSLVVALAAGNQPTGDMDTGATGVGSHGPNGDARDNLALDFGFFSYASIGDFVWNDTNANGIQDSGETGLAGVLVSLYRPGYGPDGIPGNADDASPLATQTTPASGAYSFAGLLPGTYQVGFGQLSGFNRTLANQGADGTKDSDPNPATGLTGNYLLTSGAVNNSIDAGYYQQVALAGNVYNDANGLLGTPVNTVDGTGTNVGGVLYANLVNASSNKVAQAVAVAADGSYGFSNVAPNTHYTVVLATTQGTPGATAPAAALPGGWVNTGENLGAGTGSDGTVDGMLAVAVTTSNVTNANFGIERPPTANTATASSQLNPGGTNRVTVPTLNGTDPEDSSVTIFTIKTLPGNGALYYDGTAVTLGQVITSYTPSLLTVDPNDGAITVSFTYSVTDAAGKESAPATVTMPFTAIGLAGIVYDDANGLTDNTVNGAGTNAGGTLYANLIDNTNKVAQVVAVGAGGSYGFGTVAPNTNYTVVLSTTQGTPGATAPAPTLPGGWVNTGENLGAGVGSDGTVDGILAVAVSTSSVTNANFGIERLPDSGTATATSQVNPGGTTSVTAAADLFSGTDPAPGTVTSIRITAFPTNATSITINGTTYTSANFPVAGVIVPANTSGQPTQAISVDPIDGAVNVVISYAAIDNAGKEDPTPGSVTLPFATVSLAGTVFDDANGLTDNAVNGTATNAGGTLYANLIDGNGMVVATVAVASNGNYGFSGLNGGSYTVVLSTTQGTPGNAAPTAALPAGWMNTGEHLGSGSGSDGTVDGILAVTVTASSVTDANFGITQFGTIIGAVRVDTNSNYVYDAGIDTGLGGVTLSLLNSSGNPVLDSRGVPITTTSAVTTGAYSFTNLLPGNYQVAETQPTAPNGQSYGSISDKDTTFAQYRAGGNPNLIGDNTLVSVTGGATNSANDFLEILDACPNTWTDWQTKWNTALGGQTAYNQNPDGDRYGNQIEYAFCMPPNSGALKPFCLFPGATVGTIDGKFRRTAGGTTDVTYYLQYSASLTPTLWQSIPIVFPPAANPNVTIANNGDGTETVTISNLESFTGMTGGQGFVRMRADLAGNPSYADVLGWTATDLELCCRTYNNPYLRCASFSGTVDVTNGVSGQTLNFTHSAGSWDLGSVLPAVPGVTYPYYLEVTSGVNEGQRFDVASASGNTVTLANDSVLDSAAPPFNTLTGAPPSTLAGASVLIHRHWTLDEVFPPSGFGASGSQTTSDEVQLFAGGAWSVYWLYNGDGPARWVDAADAGMSNKGTTVIPPGQGMFFNNRTTASSVLAYGEVRANGFIRPLGAGYNLPGGGYPVDQSATGTAGRAMTLDAGFFGSRDFKTADSFFVWNADATVGATGYTTYYLLNGSPVAPSMIRWIKVGDAAATSRDNETLLLGNRAVFLRAATALPAYGYPSPWTP